MGDPLAPNVTSQPAQAPSAAAPAAQEGEALPALPVKLPEPYQNLPRPIQTTGVLVALLENGRIALRTAAGAIELTLLPQQAQAARTDAAAAAQSLAPKTDAAAWVQSSLTSLAETSKPLNLVIEAGSPPQKATLFLPRVEARLAPTALQTQAPLAATGQTQAPLQAAKTTLPFFVKGETLNLAPLPDGLDEQFLTAPTAKSAPASLPTLSQAEATALKLFLGAAQSKISQSVETLVSLFKPQSAQADKAGQAPLLQQEAALLKQAQPAPAAQPLTAAGQVKIEALLSPQADWPAPTASSPTLHASVAGKTLGGHLVLEAQGQTFLVRQTGDLPLGAKLVLTPLSSANAPPYTLPLPEEIDGASLRQMLAALELADPAASAFFVKTRLPSPANSLSGTALFLLSALQAGKIDAWLGPSLQTALAKVGQRDAFQRVADEMGDILQTLSNDPRVGEWRAYPLPVQTGAGLEMLRLYVHDSLEGKTGEKTEKKETARKTRFIISITMNRLGAMQLDGLSRPKQLDLVVRSERPLPDSLPDELRTHYLKTLEATGMTGSIAFQTGRKNWIFVEETGAGGEDFLA